MQLIRRILSLSFISRPLAGGERAAARCPFPKLHTHSQLFGLRASDLRASQLRAPNLLLNQGPSEPCYSTAWPVEGHSSITVQLALTVYSLTVYTELDQLMPWLQLRCDYDTTTIRLSDYGVSRAPASSSTQAKNERQVFVVVVSQSNGMHVVISITSVVIECVVVSSYRSRNVVESQ